MWHNWPVNIKDLITETKTFVSRGDERKYYRFRAAPFYGGIATADCVGCCLRCVFCWSYDCITQPEKRGRFYTPDQVVERLVKIADQKNFHQVRISGNEPTLNPEHLLKVLDLMPDRIRFILETNGIVLGLNRDLCNELSKHNSLHVRISLKGCSEEEFETLTGMEPDGFRYQVRSIEHLVDARVSCHAAVMSMSTADSLSALHSRLGEIDPGLRDLEIEDLITYPRVLARLRKRGLGT